jgi:hypothetical protein
MRLLRLCPALFLVIGLLAPHATAQERDTTLPRVSPNAAVSFQLGVTEIEVTYGAPSVRDRTIFGDLVPYGEVWRTGANEATTISFSTDVLVEGQPLDAGTYMLATIPRPESWTVIVNGQAGQWGTYQYDPDHDILRVEVTPSGALFTETMSFTFEELVPGEELDEVQLVLHWADVHVPIRIQTHTYRHVEERAAAAVLADDWRGPLTFANYALQSGRHMDRALEWADAAIQMNESYSTLALKARLQAAAGDYTGAVHTAHQALALAAAMDEPPANARVLQEQVDQWGEQ